MKDPAFLFYSQDFFMGTYGMTDAQVGQYIRLLCLQHTKGHLSEDIMAGTMGGALDVAIISKFKVDENGLFYNERLDQEVNRRKEYSNSRRNNRNKATPDNLSIYLIKNDDDGLVKIGSSNNPERRILELKAQMKTKNLRLIATIDGVSQDIERELHAKYTNLLAFNEWYRLNDMTVSEIVADYDMNNHMIVHMETETICTNNTTNLDKTVTKKGVIGGNKHRYGEYQNVLLSDSDLEKLKAEIPGWEAMIDRLSGYMKSTGKVYKDHLATMRNWNRRDNGTGRTAGNHDRPGAGPDAGDGNLSEYANLPAIRC